MMDSVSDDDFRGVYFPDPGGFRIKELKISFSEAGEGSTSIGGVETRADVWQHWLSIAVKHARIARRIREGNPGVDGAEFKDSLIHEMQASLVSVTAAAVAVEAFKESALHHVPSARTPSRSADARVHQALQRCFRFDQAASKSWRRNLQQLFRLRDRAVHPRAAWDTPGRHTHFPVALDPKYLWFRSENAVTVSEMAVSLIAYCLSNPRARYAELTAWCEGAKAWLPADLHPADDGAGAGGAEGAAP